MKTLSIDIETFSSVDIKKSGAYAYVDSPDFEILLFAYAYDEGEVKVIDLINFEEIPESVIEDLFNPSVRKTAFNANFERICLSKHLARELSIGQWSCTAVLSLTLGLPGNLDGVSKALKLPQDKMKLDVGKNLIKYFCVPCKPTKTNGGRTRNMPEHNLEKWEDFKKYNAQDVEAERAVRNKLLKFGLLPEEQKLWFLDQKINDAGVRIDKELVSHAIVCDKEYQEKLLAEAARLTGIENPKSVPQLKKWLEDEEGIIVDSLNKENIPELLAETENQTVKRMLEIRQETAKTSIKKYQAMERAVCEDSRIRGLLQFYGASRTGRWAGRLVQVQNLPKNHMSDLDTARRLLKSGAYDMLEFLFDSVPNVLSQLIRTAFIPAEGHRFIVADFSAIEARIIAWLANEKWRLDVFKGHGKIYEASAAQMFKVPIESITKASPLRQKGKVAELALGYQGGPGALIKMGALKQGLAEGELPELVAAWRKANPAIVKLWRDTEDAAIKAVNEKIAVHFAKNITFIFNSGLLFIKLPSGRKLAYVRPQIETDKKFGTPKLFYEGINDTKQWGKIGTYGGMLVENIVQAIARDCLREALFRIDKAEYKIVMHVHDEAVIEAPQGFGSLKHVCGLMSEPIAWAPGLPLNADGFECSYYKKDD